MSALDLVTGSPYLGTPSLTQIIPSIIAGVSLPENIERNAVGGPRFNTSVYIGTNGLENRGINWPRQLGHWSINLGYREDTDADYIATVNAFYVVRGNAYGFLFRDWSDYSAKGQPLAPAVGGYQLQKIYTGGVGSYARKITRPEQGTVVVMLNGAVQTAAVVDYTTGIVSGIPAGCKANFSFFVPVRFDTDALSIATERVGVVNIQSIDLVEIAE